MILIPHLVVGAAIAAKIPYWPLVIVLAFLSHYFLDFFPHTEYSIKNIKQKQWQKIKPDIFKIALDLIIGLILVSLIQWLTNIKPLLVFTAAFFAILPDILIVLRLIFPENAILQKNFALHQKIHFLNDRKLSNYWRVLVQAAFIILGFAILL